MTHHDTLGRGRPEALLGTLNSALLRLRGALLATGSGEDDLDEKLLQVLRNTCLTEAIAGRYLFAVAGSNGAGKTTLVRETYGLDDTWLAPNPGRGEQSPIFVTEDDTLADATGAVGRLWEIQAPGGPGTERLQAREASPGEWRGAARGLASRVLLVELLVPATFFGQTGAGFLLLPGYEEQSEANSTWQGMMRRALVASPGAVVVTEESRLAGSQQQAIVADLERQFGGKIRPIVTVSRTENIQDRTRRSELQQRASEVFGVATSDVVLTGTGSSYQRWVGELRDALVRRWSQSSDARQLQLDQLGELLRRELRPALRRVRRQAEIGELIGDAPQYQEWLECFDSAARDARMDYALLVGEALDRQLAAAGYEADRLAKESGGWEGLWKRLELWLKVRADEGRRARDRQVVDLWNGAAKGASGLQTKHVDLVRKVQWQVANRALESTPGRPEQGRPDPKAISGDVEDVRSGSDVADLMLPGHLLQDSLFLAGASRAHADGSASREMVPPSGELPASIRMMPATALEVVRLATSTVAVSTHGTTISESVPTSGDLQATLQSLADNRRVLLKGAVAIIGIDLLADGDIDSIPALANAVQSLLFGSSAGSVAAAVSTAIAGGLIGGAAAAALVQYANQVNAKDRQRVEAMLSGAREHSEALLLQDFDRLMAEFRARIEARLRGYLNVDAEAVRRLSLQKALADADSALAAVMEAQGASLDVA